MSATLPSVAARGMSSLLALAASEKPEPAAVAREFEALLVGELTRQAAKPLPGTRPLDGGSAGRLYREQFFQEVARLAAARGGLGIAAAIERQIGGGGARSGDASS